MSDEQYRQALAEQERTRKVLRKAEEKRDAAQRDVDRAREAYHAAMERVDSGLPVKVSGGKAR